MNACVFVKILKILNSQPKSTAKELAEATNMSVRNVYRVVNDMICAGILIDLKPGTGGVFIC